MMPCTPCRALRHTRIPFVLACDVFVLRGKQATRVHPHTHTHTLVVVAVAVAEQQIDEIKIKIKIYGMDATQPTAVVYILLVAMYTKRNAKTPDRSLQPAI